MAALGTTCLVPASPSFRTWSLGAVQVAWLVTEGPPSYAYKAWPGIRNCLDQAQ